MGNIAPIQEKREYLAHMDYVLALSQLRTQPYTTTVLGKEFIILPNVFSPEYNAETAFYTQQVINLLKAGEDYLDLGCGAGVTAVIAASKGANVTALDVNPDAIENTIQNAKLHGFVERIRVLKSNVYSAVVDKKFDTIFWNPPFAFRKNGIKLTLLQEAVYDPGYRNNRKFVMGARKHLKPGGQLLMGVSTTLGNLDAIQKFARKANISFLQIAEMHEPDPPYDIKYQLLKATLSD